MIQIGILSIGNEILNGVTLGTNAHWMTQQIVALGGEVDQHIVVRDNQKAICRAIKHLLKNSLTFIITTGGLGPTHDDITVASIAQCLGLPLVLDQTAEAIIKRQYKKLFEQKIVPTSKLTPARLKMAMLPKGANALDNTIGGAPGVFLKVPSQKKYLILLPGVPEEMKQIFTESFIPLLTAHLEKTSGSKYYQDFCEIPAPDESTFSPHIDFVSKQVPKVYIKSMPKPYGTKTTLRIWVSARGESRQEAKRSVEKAIHLLRKWEEKNL